MGGNPRRQWGTTSNERGLRRRQWAWHALGQPRGVSGRKGQRARCRIRAPPIRVETGALFVMFPVLGLLYPSSFCQATMASDNHLRVYECLEAPTLTNWTLSEETDIPALPSILTSRPHTYAAPTPTQISGTPAADASLVANALQQQQQQPAVQRGAGSREADGGWSVTWCKERYWGEVLATCSGVSGVVKVTLILILAFHFFSREAETRRDRLYNCLLRVAQSPFFRSIPLHPWSRGPYLKT